MNDHQKKCLTKTLLNTVDQLRASADALLYYRGFDISVGEAKRFISFAQELESWLGEEGLLRKSEAEEIENHE